MYFYYESRVEGTWRQERMSNKNRSNHLESIRFVLVHLSIFLDSELHCLVLPHKKLRRVSNDLATEHLVFNSTCKD